MKNLIRPSVAAMQAYVPGEQPNGADILKLNTNENPYPPSPKVFEALGGINADVLRKYPHPTAAKLREALATLHGVGADQVFVANGSDEVLALCTRAFSAPGGKAGGMDPSYSLYPILCDIAELRWIRYPLEDDFSWRVPDLLDVDLFFLTRPNAPTGMSLPLDAVRKAADACAGVFVVDEAYADFAEDDAVALLDELPNLLISRSFSKSYSLAGLRLGYVLGHPTLIAALDKIKDSYNVDALAQRMGLAAVEDHAWMLSNVTAVRGTREAASKALETRGFAVLPSEANFLFARVPPGYDAATLHAQLKNQHVFVRHFPGARTGAYLRITVGTDADMTRFFDTLDRVLSI